MLVGVHSPEFAFERERSNVEDAVERLGLDYPVALDSDFETWQAWDNRYWPAKYFVDREGRVRYAHFGEGDYAESERVIQELLAEPGLPDLVSDDVDAPEGSDGRRHARDVPRLRRASTASAAARSPRTRGRRTPSRRTSRRTGSPIPAAGRSRRSGSSPATTRGCGSTSARAA